MDMLKVKDGHIVDEKDTIVMWKGLCIGGWMNMEFFINGYPGAEHGVRSALADTIGNDMADYFFERMSEYFLTEKDVMYIKSLGVNVVRLPLNYRHFESDLDPFVYMESAFLKLDGMIRLFEKYGIYIILDLHAIQGWQNYDWHCDNDRFLALFWEQKVFQDRFVSLWSQIAKRYKDNPVIAGYDLMNEPVSGIRKGFLVKKYEHDWSLINNIYKRTVYAIREIDKNHIIILEGDNFSSLFNGLDEPFDDNLVYSCHNYVMAAWIRGEYPGLFNGVYWDIDKQKDAFAAHQGVIYTRKHNVPLWVGEFGVSISDGYGQEDIKNRIKALDDQIDVYEVNKVHWTLWTYKDMGRMGILKVPDDSEYVRLLWPVYEAEVRIGTRDALSPWIERTPIRESAYRMSQMITDEINDPLIINDAVWPLITRLALSSGANTFLQYMYAGKFKGSSKYDIDNVLKSFCFDNCVANNDLADIIRKRGNENEQIK